MGIDSDVYEAMMFAYGAHKAIGQKRKRTGLCYTTHVNNVARIVSNSGAPSYLISAAYLHDVVEDTKVTVEDINYGFGEQIASVVEGLTKITVVSDVSRAHRSKIERERLAQADNDVQWVKLADLIDNLSDCLLEAQRGENIRWIKVYVEEKRQLMNIMLGGPQKLRIQVLKLIDDIEKELEKC